MSVLLTAGLGHAQVIPGLPIPPPRPTLPDTRQDSPPVLPQKEAPSTPDVPRQQDLAPPVRIAVKDICETAIGDDRAALGLAGVAVKAGARSAFASLWLIDDEATSQLVREFYQQLKNPTMSKAAALQQAQLKIASEPNHDHPSYWAPFLLINNWL